MPKKNKIRVKKTPNCRHPYTATMVGEPTYDWGNTPQEARTKLLQNLEAVSNLKSPNLKSR